MSIDSLERYLGYFNSRTPFRPYLIELASGDRMQVRHPEAVARIGDTYYLRAPDRELRLFEADAVVQLVLPSPSS